MNEKLRRLFHATKQGSANSKVVKILLSLKEIPDDEFLGELKEIGLEITSLEKDKIVGQISSNLIATLEAVENVVTVEASYKLKIHGNANFKKMVNPEDASEVTEGAKKEGQEKRTDINN